MQGRRQDEHHTDVTRLPGNLATGGITVIGRRLLIRPTAMLACRHRLTSDGPAGAVRLSPASRPPHRRQTPPARSNSMTARANWRDDAACRDADPDLFFPIGTTGPALRQIGEAKRVCRTCPAQTQCLAWALDDPAEPSSKAPTCGAGGARTRDRQIMGSTFVHSTSLNSNDASLRCDERTRGAGSFMGAGPRPGPRRALPGSYRRDAA
jgi:hypothetical protein